MAPEESSSDSHQAEVRMINKVFSTCDDLYIHKVFAADDFTHPVDIYLL